ncbi:alpha/beta hydrolase [Candidatus Saccharibacteria bacterium]|nr:MAG: alpha/beta hydrolase [Candidatus Saccharibacteria bacterium]
MKNQTNPTDFIEPLHVNGMRGRLLRVPSSNRRKREILLLYGHHAQLERWWGLVQNLQSYGNITAPDLPGFGGMDSFFKIGKQPTIDAYADYLAAFIKMYYKRHRVTLMGISFGFLVITRMLQRYPELAKKVDFVVSIVGFMHKDDFLFPPKRRVDYHIITRIMGAAPVSYLIRYLALNTFVIKNVYVRLPAGRRRFIAMERDDFKRLMDYEVRLWQINDVRTHWRTTSEFLEIDNCQVQINLPVWHVQSSGDHYFDNAIVEQHMRVVYRTYEGVIMKSPAHTPSILGDKNELSVMLPPQLRKQLARKQGA